MKQVTAYPGVWHSLCYMDIFHRIRREILISHSFTTFAGEHNLNIILLESLQLKLEL